MLDKGRMIKVDTPQAFAALRDHPESELAELDETQQLVRQFLRGDAEGPITRRKADTNYAEDLLGTAAVQLTDVPSVEATRQV